MDELRMDEQMKEQVALYALGALTPQEAAFMRAQCATNVELQGETAAYAAIVNELAWLPSAVAPLPALRAQLLARIAATPQEPSPKKLAVKAETPVFVTRFDEGKWTELAPHVFSKVLHHDAASQFVTSLIKLEPGGFLPRHRHLGLEQTLIVSGDCIVNGATFYAGDFRLREAGTEDTEVTTQFGTTILMIAPEHIEILDAAWAC